MPASRRWLLSLILLLVQTGCRYSTHSGLPDHIKTVEVELFQNETFYKGLEQKLTQAVIEQINLTPNLKVVPRNGDAVLSGVIKKVNNTVVRQDMQDRPASVQTSIVAEYSLEDAIEGTMLYHNVRISSSRSSASAGLYDIDRGEARESAEDAAIRELAKEIVRRTLGAW